ncbi:hypothetical protein SAMN05421823_101533 [Catalinimonas alkaloidigena]|uniref:ATP-grasp domain-containing protein n=1 Tax=Catalinimonas alkaloidigena TaxID=1075417 RepID=A0A1G8Y0J0_9BACT|nr:hypothetical protein [Catalinimonas alkaloidigena]SDJ96292.1 hypothetical protein SAMN05421823_101533 [Catalinimonas alkaloidigena]
MRSLWHRLTRWEFWPFWVFYIPVYPYWLWLSMKARSLAFFTAANPTMEWGGFVNYSKWNTLRQLPETHRPRTLVVEVQPLSVESMLTHIERQAFAFPLVLKPDMGERGLGVAIVQTAADLIHHLERWHSVCPTWLIQEFVDAPLEFGVMYHRLPGHTHGSVTSVVQKQVPLLRGDGHSSLATLLATHPRAKLQLELWRDVHQARLDWVPTQEEPVPLGQIGNHCRGAIFLDGNALINTALTQVFDQLSQHVPGFYIGRYDVKAASLDALYTGQGLTVLELNGANSEPAHIYDPDMPLLQAYRHLFRHWRMLYRISVLNHRRGVPYTSALALLRQIRQHLALTPPSAPQAAPITPAYATS